MAQDTRVRDLQGRSHAFCCVERRVCPCLLFSLTTTNSYSYEFKNKRVGVIGGGSSSIQIVPNLQKVEGVQMTCFVRSRTWIANPFGDSEFHSRNSHSVRPLIINSGNDEAGIGAQRNRKYEILSLHTELR
jgi:hypothetical protein